MTTALTLERSRGLIADLERRIELDVQRLHETTGLRIYDVRLSETDVSTVGLDDDKKYFYRVKVEVML